MAGDVLEILLHSGDRRIVPCLLRGDPADDGNFFRNSFPVLFQEMDQLGGFAFRDAEDGCDAGTDDPFDNETFTHSKTKFYAVCSNVETGCPEYVLCRDMFKDIDFLRASASMPFVSQIVEAGGMKLLDGGITDSIPLQAAFKLGYERNIVIQTRPAGYRKKPAHTGWLAKLFYGKYPKFVSAIKTRHLMYNRELDEIEQMRDDGRILVIRPSRLVKIGKMEQNPAVVKEMYELGRYDAEAALESVKKFLKRGENEKS